MIYYLDKIKKSNSDLYEYERDRIQQVIDFLKGLEMIKCKDQMMMENKAIDQVSDLIQSLIKIKNKFLSHELEEYISVLQELRSVLTEVMVR